MDTTDNCHAHASLYTPQLITDKNITFVIPLYQRLFAWTPKEVSGFLEDIEDHFTSKNPLPYYFGVITQIQESDYMMSLVDGQQRMTIIVLMAIVFTQKPEAGDARDLWNAFWYNGERLKFFARPHDGQYLKALKGKSSDSATNNSYENGLIKDAFNEICNFTERMKENLESFASFVYNNLTIIVSELPKAYIDRPTSLNQHFECMNSEGKNLESHEVMKVKLLTGNPKITDTDKEYMLKIWNLCSDFSKSILTKPQKDEDTENGKEPEYVKAIKFSIDKDMKQINNILNEFNSESSSKPTPKTIGQIAQREIKKKAFAVRQFRDERAIINFPQFLLLALNLFNKNKVEAKSRANFKVEEILSLFDKNLLRKDIKDFYNFMLRLRIIIDYYVIRCDADGNYNLFCTRQSGDGKEDPNVGEKLKQYQAMLYVSSSEYYGWLYDYLLMLIDKNEEQLSQSLLCWLKTWDNNRKKLPSFDKLSYPFVDRYIFWRLDYYLWERFIDGKDKYSKEEENSAVANYVFRQNRSIEHLHPQNENNFNDRDKWPTEAINSFGNLAMISQSFNSIQSNDAVSIKFARIEEQIKNNSLQSMKLLAMYIKANREKAGWTIDIAKDHEKEMLEILLESF